MPLALLVNPSSAGGRTLKLLPRVEQALDARRVDFRVAAHQGPRARRRAGAAGGRSRRDAGRDERRRPGRRGRRRDGRRRDAARDHPRRPRQRPRPRARHPRRARGGRRACSPPARAARIDVGEANGKRFLGIVSVGFDSEANRLANETKFMRGNLVYAYAALRTLVALEAGALHGPRRRRARRASPATRSRSPTTAPSAAACSSPRTPSSTTALFDVVTVGEVGKLRFLANLPKVFKGTHVEDDEVRVFRAPQLELSAEPARSPSTPTASTSPTCRPRCASCPRALSVIVPPRPRLSRAARRRGRSSAPSVARRARSAPPAGRSGRGGGTTLPGRLLLRLAPDAIARLGARPRPRRRRSSAPPTARRRPPG